MDKLSYSRIIISQLREDKTQTANEHIKIPSVYQIVDMGDDIPATVPKLRLRQSAHNNRLID